MSPEKKRVSIAKACGWKDCDINWLQKPALLLGSKPTFSNGKIISYLVDQTIPHYLTDLNACHEMEEVLTHDQQIDYMEWLGLCDDDHGHKLWAYVHATAAERCKAFRRVMGLCEEEME